MFHTIAIRFWWLLVAALVLKGRRLQGLTHSLELGVGLCRFCICYYHMLLYDMGCTVLFMLSAGSLRCQIIVWYVMLCFWMICCAMSCYDIICCFVCGPAASGGWAPWGPGFGMMSTGTGQGWWAGRLSWRLEGEAKPLLPKPLLPITPPEKNIHNNSNNICIQGFWLDFKKDGLRSSPPSFEGPGKASARASC